MIVTVDAKRRVKRRSGWLDVWKKCPVSMDDIPSRSREYPKKLNEKISAARV